MGGDSASASRKSAEGSWGVAHKPPSAPAQPALSLPQMNDSAQRRAERLRKALRENIRRRKAAPDAAVGEGMARRADLLEPRMQPAGEYTKKDKSGGN
jgi:hypothetical protein